MTTGARTNAMLWVLSLMLTHAVAPAPPLACAPRVLASPTPRPEPRVPLVRVEPPWLSSFEKRARFEAARVVLDGWAFYAKAGGMVVATGQSTHPWVYDCDTRWDGETPFCRIGRTGIKMPNQAFMLVGMSFIVVQDVIRRMRGSTGPRYKLRDVLSGGRVNLRAAVALTPLINFSILENGAYANILFSL